MGKVGGEARGKTKFRCWMTFRAVVKCLESQSLYPDYPHSREHAYEVMTRDEKTREWVLKYHFSA